MEAAHVASPRGTALRRPSGHAAVGSGHGSVDAPSLRRPRGGGARNRPSSDSGPVAGDVAMPRPRMPAQASWRRPRDVDVRKRHASGEMESDVRAPPSMRGRQSWRAPAMEETSEAMAPAAQLCEPDTDDVGIEANDGDDDKVPVSYPRQRVRSLKLKTSVHPDVLVSYLYGNRRGHHLNAIMARAGATIDYCPLSPDEQVQSPQSGAHLMNFLVSAESLPQLNAACQHLRVLVSRVQMHVEKKHVKQSAEDGVIEFAAASPHAQDSSSHEDMRHIPVEIRNAPHYMGKMPARSAFLKPEPMELREPLNRFKFVERHDLHYDISENGDDEDYDMEQHVRALPPRRRYPEYDYLPRRFASRPVYRHVLVDEDGYALYPTYERVRRRSISSVVRSPTLDHSETDEMAGVRRTAHFQDDALRLPPARFTRNKNLDGIDSNRVGQRASHHHVDMLDGQEYPANRYPGGLVPRRGLKRRLDNRERASDLDYQPQSFRRGQTMLAEMNPSFLSDEFSSSDDDIYVSFRPEHDDPQCEIRMAKEILTKQGSCGGDDMHIQHENCDTGEEQSPEVLTHNQGKYIVQPISSSPVASFDEVNPLADEAPVQPEIPGLVPKANSPPPNYRPDFGNSTPQIDSPDQEEGLAKADITLSSPLPTCDPSLVDPSVDISFGGDDATGSDSDLEKVDAVPRGSCSADSSVAAGADRLPDPEEASTATDYTGYASHLTVPKHPAEHFVSYSRDTPSVRTDDNPTLGDTSRDLQNQGDMSHLYSADEDLVAHHQTKIDGQLEVEHQQATSFNVQANEALISCLNRVNHAQSTRPQICLRVKATRKRLQFAETNCQSQERIRQLFGRIRALHTQLMLADKDPLTSQQRCDTLYALEKVSEKMWRDGTAQSMGERITTLRTELENVFNFNLDAVSKQIIQSNGVTTQHKPPVDSPIISTKHPLELRDDDDRANIPRMANLPDQEVHRATSDSDDEDDAWEKSYSATRLLKAEDKSVNDVSDSGIDGKLKREFHHLDVPAQAPSFIGNFINALVTDSSVSSVMISAQRCLTREVAKSDPYYYLHPRTPAGVATEGAKENEPSVCSSCPFGCFAGSAVKWERKVVSQISSRMKWFDSVAYSLTKVSGGKELLSRKKMNSTIRKLHLVALQLHCLVSHLYCVRKQVTCREIDSLPTALNNSYYEKRMNGYKTRLKLSAHRQLPCDSVSEELMRDTFEFFPELLLSVDIWGYDHRTKLRNQSHGHVNSERNDARGEITGQALLIQRICQLVGASTFDFDRDENGMLQSICEELLNILCLWNEFNWGECLESLTYEKILVFDRKVKRSICKILELHTGHLLALWASQLVKSPQEMLQGIRLTQPNAYYSELPVSIIGCQRGPVEEISTGPHLDQQPSGLREPRVLAPASTAAVVDAFWSQHDHDQDYDHDDTAARKPSPPTLSAYDLNKWETDEAGRHVLKWSEVYNLRQDCHTLVTVATDLEQSQNSSGRWPHIGEMTSSTSDLGDFAEDDGVGGLLEKLARARTVLYDAMDISDKLALHSTGYQLLNPQALSVVDGSAADDEAMSDDSTDDLIVNSLVSSFDTRAAADGKRVTEPLTRNRRNDPVTSVGSTHSADDEDEDRSAYQPAQHRVSGDAPDVKDLMEIVTSTNQDVTEICNQRARSARVRDKLQGQSIELARQSIQLLHSVLNMT